MMNSTPDRPAMSAFVARGATENDIVSVAASDQTSGRVVVDREAEDARTFLAAIVESSEDAIIGKTLDGTILTWNQAAEGMYGYRADEAIGQSISMLMPRDCQDETASILRRIKEGRTLKHYETVRINKAGRSFEVSLTVSPVKDASGTTVGAATIARDISERRRAEQATRLTAERFRTLFERSLDCLYVHDFAGNFLDANPATLKLLGYERKDIPSINVSSLLSPDQMPKALQAITDLAETGTCNETIECKLKGPGGAVAFTEHRLTVIPWDGTTHAILGIARDITERKKVDETRALLASVIESSEDAIASAMLDGTILSWNRSAEVLLGYSAGDIIGKNASILAPPGCHHDPDKILADLGTGASHHYETTWIRKDGRLLDVAVTVSPIINSAGELVGTSVITRDVGERVRAEQRLRESDERFRSAFEAAPFGMCMSELSGRFIKVNSTFCRMLGYSELELLARTWTELTHSDDGDVSKGAFERLLAEPSASVEIEKRYLHRSGQIVWARTRISLVGDGSGLPSYFVVHIEDISGRKLAEAALRESEQRFQIMADGCPTVLWVTDAQGGIRFVNRACNGFFGTIYDQVEGGKWQPLLHPDDAAQYLGSFLAAVQEHTSFRSQARVRRSDGAWRWVASYAEPRWSPDGEFLGHVGLSPDITERKQAEDELRNSEEKFRQLAENTSEVFWMMNPAGTEMLYVSPAYERIWGETCEELYRNPMAWFEAIEPEDRARAHAAFSRQLAGESIESEYRIRTRAGEVKWVRDRAFSVRDQAGKITRIVGVAEDITGRKQADAERQKAKDAAEAANRAKSEFLANMSHEIRTPMNGVIGMTGLLLDTDLTAEQRQYAEIVRSSGEALLAVINDILDFSKIEARKLDLEIADFDLRERSSDLHRLAVSPSARQRTGIEGRCESRDTAWVARRLRPLAAGLGQSRRQRHQVYRPGRGAYPSEPGSRGRRFCGDPILGGGYRNWYPCRSPSCHFRAFHARGRFHHAQIRRHWPRTSHKQAIGGTAGRPHWC